jgi:hypothetical protein
MDRNYYVPSINILRDAKRNITYIPTPNGKRIVSQMVDDFRKGLRAFNLIGSYGGYSAEGDHVIPWQTEHVFSWRTSAANAVSAFQS